MSKEYELDSKSLKGLNCKTKLAEIKLFIKGCKKILFIPLS